MEKEIKIKTSDGFQIYGTLSTPRKKTDKLVIFVHGFTGHRNAHIFFNGAKYMNAKGAAAFRFDLYNAEKGARHFKDTKISQHGDDITTVVSYFRKKYKKIYVVGHSYGGTSLLFADTSKVNALVFWDASWIDPKEEKKDFRYNSALDRYVWDWRVEYLVGKAYVEELRDFPDCGELVAKITAPKLFITAGKQRILKGKKYMAAASQFKKHVNISGADHNFNSFKAEDRLLEETWKWIKRY